MRDLLYLFLTAGLGRAPLRERFLLGRVLEGLAAATEVVSVSCAIRLEMASVSWATGSKNLRLIIHLLGLVHALVGLVDDVGGHVHVGELRRRAQGDVALHGRAASLAVQHFRNELDAVEAVFTLTIGEEFVGGRLCEQLRRPLVLEI